MPYHKLSISYQGRTEAEQAALILEQMRTLDTKQSLSLMFCGNADQWRDCIAYNDDKSRALSMGAGATGQAKVMQELLKLLQQEANKSLKARVNFLPIVTAGRRSLCIGVSNLFHGSLNMRPLATASFVDPLAHHVRQQLEAGGAVIGLANQATSAEHLLQIGGGAQRGEGLGALVELYRASIDAAVANSGTSYRAADMVVPDKVAATATDEMDVPLLMTPK